MGRGDGVGCLTWGVFLHRSLDFSFAGVRFGWMWGGVISAVRSDGEMMNDE